MWNVQVPVLRGQERVQLLSSQHPKVSLSADLLLFVTLFFPFTFYVTTLCICLHEAARAPPVIINLFWPNEDEMLTQSSKVKLYIVFRRVPQRRSWICACLCVE